MSLTEISTGNVIKKQVRYKLRAYSGAFTTLMFIQFLGILFSLGGTGSYYIGGIYNVEGTHYSSISTIVLVGIWAFITAILLTTKADRGNDFAFVTNRFTSSMSNGCFLGIMSIVGGVTSILSGFLLALIIYFTNDMLIINLTGGLYGVSQMAAGVLSTILYILLASALGYLAGSLVQLHPVMKITLPVIFFGLLFSGAFIDLGWVGEMYFLENSITLFTVKALLTAGIFLGASAWMTNRQEVM
ncbi:hypothetical protein CR205_10400 [Alteribacter lacisalsi]|uniref:ABC transporter permease n=1 Tax=Alteribacter lacisalsi TaxID=2045244 RepID=A0A2W0HAS1_9BACI|nr:hypothetical protein [Alteribacter lacisalsi]PYZ98954.1 hypothetical protein CR205_10400 [Alteribacter lacisalsi]